MLEYAEEGVETGSHRSKDSTPTHCGLLTELALLGLRFIYLN